MLSWFLLQLLQQVPSLLTDPEHHLLNSLTLVFVRFCLEVFLSLNTAACILMSHYISERGIIDMSVSLQEVG